MTHTDPFGADALAKLSVREQRTVIGHAAIDLMSPMSEKTLAQLVGQVPLGGSLLDVGCGKAALARNLLRNDPGASATCIERNPILAAQGEVLARKEGILSRLQMIVADARQWKAARKFDAIALLGATRAIGSLQDVLDYGKAHLKAGGVVLLGEGIWVARPVPEYLSFLGADENDLMTREALMQEVQKAGFVLRYQHLSSPEEWEAYEAPYFQNLRAHEDPSSQHPSAKAADTFEAMQIKYGRTCMGFMVMAVAWEG